MNSKVVAMISSLLPLSIFMNSTLYRRVNSFNGAFQELESLQAATLIECATICSLLQPPGCNGFRYEGRQCTAGLADLQLDETNSGGPIEMICKNQFSFVVSSSAIRRETQDFSI